MKKSFYFLTVLIMALLSAGCGSQPQSNTAQQYDRERDFSVTASDNGVTIVGYSGRNTNIRIPPQIQGKPVTSIGDKAFTGKKLTSVTIPNGVTSIGDEAFYQNQLTSVTIPDSVTIIGDGAFQENRLTNVTIPDSVTNIGDDAFAENHLASVTIPDRITSIGQEAFNGNRLTSVTVPNSVTSVGERAFGNARLVAPKKLTFGKISNDDLFKLFTNAFRARYQAVPNDRSGKLFYDLASFNNWRTSNSHSSYYQPLTNISTIVGNDNINDTFIDKAILFSAPERYILFFIFINDTADELTLKQLLFANSLYYTQKLLVGWMRQTNNRTQTPIDRINTILVLQDGDTVRYVNTQYLSIVYDTYDTNQLIFYNKEIGLFMATDIEDFTIKQLKTINP